MADEVSIVETGCIGSCAGGPLVVVYPDGVFYTKVQPEDVAEIVAEHLVKGRPVERLMYRHPGSQRGHPAGQRHPVLRAPEPRAAQLGPDRPGEHRRVHRPRRLPGPGQGAHRDDARGGHRRDQDVRPARPRRRRLPHRAEVAVRRAGRRRPEVRRLQRRRRRPGRVHGPQRAGRRPARVIEGMAHRAPTPSARDEGYIYVRAEYPLAVERLEHRARRRRRECGLLGKNILGTGFELRPRDPHGLRRLRLRRRDRPDDLDRGQPRRAAARGRRSRPHKGLWGKPTRPEQRRDLRQRAGDHPATAPSGTPRTAPRRARAPRSSPWPAPSRTPAWSKCPIGMPLGDLIYDIGGGIPDGKEFKAAQIGGPSGGCIPKRAPQRAAGLRIAARARRDHGLRRPDRHGRGHLHGRRRPLLPRVRPGGVAAASASPAASAPSGCWRSSTASARARAKRATSSGSIDLGEMIKDTALCGLGQTAPNPVLSTIRHFRQEYEEHIRDKHCEAGVCAALVKAPLLQRLPGQRRHPRLRVAGRREALRRGAPAAPRAQPVGQHLRARLLPPLREQVPRAGTRRAGRDPRRQALHGRAGEAARSCRRSGRTPRTPRRKVAVVGAGPGRPLRAPTSSPGSATSRSSSRPSPRPAACSSRPSRPTACRATSSSARVRMIEDMGVALRVRQGARQGLHARRASRTRATRPCSWPSAPRRAPASASPARTARASTTASPSSRSTTSRGKGDGGQERRRHRRRQRGHRRRPHRPAPRRRERQDPLPPHAGADAGVGRGDRRRRPRGHRDHDARRPGGDPPRRERQGHRRALQGDGAGRLRPQRSSPSGGRPQPRLRGRGRHRHRRHRPEARRRRPSWTAPPSSSTAGATSPPTRTPARPRSTGCSPAATPPPVRRRWSRPSAPARRRPPPWTSS